MTPIERARPEDAGEILTLQRAAYVVEAQLYGDPFIAPLVESLEGVRAAIDSATVLKAVDGGRIVGAVRGRLGDRAGLIGRLVVAPDRQGLGLGTALMRAIEDEMSSQVKAFDLFTGHLSEGNLRLYRRLGYRETRRERVHEHLTMVYMRKHS
ncbi:GNAT family N-acetyltransferase [Sphaerisporangium dianthi]|uniref:GNAT family N-acetyltransferase n=1 Tax=Sphaerisporangium dianthi TaxID=1436120 RepID=A0ABV9CI77_9ACTN